MRATLRTAILAAWAIVGSAAAGAAIAQAFPAKPITLICPWPPGGSTDQHLRAFAQILKVRPWRPKLWAHALEALLRVALRPGRRTRAH